MSETLTRSALARLAGVSADTLRHYERKGVLAAPPRSANGYRRYPRTAIARVQLVQHALAVGFSLSELARMLRERDAGGVPCRKVHALVTARLAGIDDQLAALTALRNELRDLLSEWDARLHQLPSGRQARLLDGLLEKPGIARAVRASSRRWQMMRGR
jgi:MerR family copper efflux transcriptional regulator